MPPVDAHTHADRAFHDATADLYEAELEDHFRAYEKLVIDPWVRTLDAGQEALDVGCGTGAMAIRLAERGLSVDGIDHSEGMLELARRKTEDEGLTPRVRLRQGDVRTLPYDDASFDVVTCQGVLHHLEDMRPCLQEITRVLRPNGRLYIAEPCTGTTRALLLAERFAKRTTKTPPPPVAHTHIPSHHEGPINADELSRHLRDLNVDHDIAYWSLFPGMHRVRPLALQRALIWTLCRPWRHRAGNMAVVTGQRPSSAQTADA